MNTITATQSTDMSLIQQILIALLQIFTNTAQTSISFLFSVLSSLISAALFQATGSTSLFGS